MIHPLSLDLQSALLPKLCALASSINTRLIRDNEKQMREVSQVYAKK